MKNGSFTGAVLFSTFKLFEMYNQYCESYNKHSVIIK